MANLNTKSDKNRARQVARLERAALGQPNKSKGHNNTGKTMAAKARAEAIMRKAGKAPDTFETYKDIYANLAKYFKG